MKQIFSAQTSTYSSFPSSDLKAALFKMQQLWLEIYNKHTDLSTTPEITGQFSVNRARLQLMMQFIHENYRKNLSLDEIAAQSMISKSSPALTELKTFAPSALHSFFPLTPVN